MISSKKDRRDSDIPMPRIKKAGDKSKEFNDPILVSSGTSVRHLLVA